MSDDSLFHVLMIAFKSWGYIDKKKA